MTDVELIKSLTARIHRNRGDVDAFDELIDLFEKQKRWSEMVGTLEAKAEVVEDVDERVALLCRAATCFIDRFANQREALRLCLVRMLYLWQQRPLAA